MVSILGIHLGHRRKSNHPPSSAFAEWVGFPQLPCGCDCLGWIQLWPRSHQRRCPVQGSRGFTYSRLNEDYRQIHQLCRLFLEGSSLSEELGAWDSRTFLLDMNKLFEQFVTQILVNEASNRLTVRAQSEMALDVSGKVRIRPDLLMVCGRCCSLRPPTANTRGWTRINIKTMTFTRYSHTVLSTRLRAAFLSIQHMSLGSRAK